MPLLILWLGHGEREATGTSLVAIVIIAAWAAGVHGLYGNLDVLKALIIALPAMLGVVGGTALQQRISSRAVAGLFAIVLVASAAALVF